jgi:hypothetical protein
VKNKKTRPKTRFSMQKQQEKSSKKAEQNKGKFAHQKTVAPFGSRLDVIFVLL